MDIKRRTLANGIRERMRGLAEIGIIRSFGIAQSIRQTRLTTITINCSLSMERSRRWCQVIPPTTTRSGPSNTFRESIERPRSRGICGCVMAEFMRRINRPSGICRTIRAWRWPRRKTFIRPDPASLALCKKCRLGIKDRTANRC